MAGGVLQLFAYGAEDLYMTDNPQITYFKIVYRRHTNFSIQTFENSFLDRPDFNKTSKTKINVLGDLITQIYLKITIKTTTPNDQSKFAWVRRLGHAIINNIKIEIGGQTIDQQLGIWLDIWYELARTGNHERGYLYLIGDTPLMTDLNNQTKPEFDLYIPIKFWFSRITGTALPIIAIQYHEVYISVEFNDYKNLIVYTQDYNNFKDLHILFASLLIDYIYLDFDERNKFSKTYHEYLIEQVQNNSYMNNINESTRKRIQLQFNYPVKELIWTVTLNDYIDCHKFLAYTNQDNWDNEIINATNRLLLDSIVVADNNPINSSSSIWIKVSPKSKLQVDNLYIDNQSPTNTWVNPNSLIYNDKSITGKIIASIKITSNSQILIQNISKYLDIIDISISTDFMTDTRIDSSKDIIVNQFGNYGLLLDYTKNPLNYAELRFNDEERFEKREIKYFSTLLPTIYHNNTPRDGINVYSFSLYPEQHQPSGACNFSRIERQILTLWYENIIKNSLFYVFAPNYNVFRVQDGLTAVVYTD